MLPRLAALPNLHYGFALSVVRSLQLCSMQAESGGVAKVGISSVEMISCLSTFATTVNACLVEDAGHFVLCQTDETNARTRFCGASMPY